MTTSVELGAPTLRRAGTTGAARWRRWRRRSTPWLFILPAVLIHLFVIGGPSIVTFFLSLTSWNGFTFGKFVGLDNFHQLLSDTTVRQALVNNFIWTAI